MLAQSNSKGYSKYQATGVAPPEHLDSQLPETSADLLHDILSQRSLTALFQPILDLKGGEFIGFEGLIRGPSNSVLHSPFNLFGAAQQHGLALEIEMLCRQVVLETFARLKLPGSLFLNVSPMALTHPSFRNGQTIEYMKQVGISPEQVIIELTENQPTFDFEEVRNALLHYRSMGFKIAMDDLGEGFSGLRLWSELRPEFVKIDMHFVQGVNTDPLKLQFLKSIQLIAESCGCHVIAEGIECEAELMAVKDTGIAMGQGYFIGHPTPTPPLVAPPEAARVISKALISVSSKNQPTVTPGATAQKLLIYIEPVSQETENNEIFARFSANHALHSIPVVKHGKPLGLINRYTFIDRFAQPFQRELLGKKPCSQTMYDKPLLVEKNTTIQEISQFLAESESRHFADGFIITDEGRYLGVGTGQDLLRAITQMQIEAARYANPLTLLPGNVPINEQIESLLHASMPFHACYCDLDNFKPFNDMYGYSKGDEMIQLTGRILYWTCDPKLDFIGHIGGDDFILLMRSPDWKKRCDNALQSFARASISLANEQHRYSGGYESEDRHGRIVFHPLPTLSIGAVQIEPQNFHSHLEVSEVAAEAKKMAKRMHGNSLFIEQRKHALQ
ncbi:MAG: EAL domain-containing protein [Sideroxydans sp.]|nr:EAL domain-containing protein [Sideroxydans sp.]